MRIAQVSNNSRENCPNLTFQESPKTLLSLLILKVPEACIGLSTKKRESIRFLGILSSLFITVRGHNFDYLAINSIVVAGKDGFTLAPAATAVVELMAKWLNLYPRTEILKLVLKMDFDTGFKTGFETGF